jgi:hypothetical protein
MHGRAEVEEQLGPFHDEFPRFVDTIADFYCQGQDYAPPCSFQP